MLTQLCTRYYRDLTTGEVTSGFLPCEVGWLLRDLTRLAEADRTLAQVGMAHLCFLLPLLIHNRPSDWPRWEPYHVGILHDRAIKAYRARVRFYREQGKGYEEAQQLALGYEVPKAAFTWAGPDGWPLDM